ncbi:MAG: DUF368 domain-containing protein [Endozoicomonas sp. (ex Botrylloides leachii)]|nr:DUF368 domain-containing protein [Endozoicomonas sp. (ex Botrylloides leachii)]
MVKNPLLLLLKGVAMGAADVVPGVSGGTIAFITGIYDELLSSLKKISPSALAILFRQGFFAFWHHINGPFLLTLGCGILLSVFTLAKGISWMLVNHPIPVWSFFSGLVLVSVWHMLRQLPRLEFFSILGLISGTGFAWWFSGMAPLKAANPELLTFFICGAVAICAMILPGISGSFLLLLLGIYEPVLQAVTTLNAPVLVVFASGCLAGLLLFSRVLSWLLANARNITMGLLTGMMLGSMNRIWPWKQINSDQISNVLPHTYEQLTGDSSQLTSACIAALAAVTLVLIIERIAERS